MNNYFDAGFFKGMEMLVSIMKDLAAMIGIPLAAITYLKIMNDLKSSPAANMMMALGRFIKPTVIFFLIFTYSQWTDLLANAIYSIPGYLQGQYDEKMQANKKFVDESGNPIDPWLYYQNVMIKARENEVGKAQSIMNAWENLPDNQKTDAKKAEYAAKWKSEIDNDPSYIGQQVNTIVFKMVDMLIEGAYFIVLLVIEKIQQGMLAFLMAVGIISLLISLIPNREGSFDVWLTYFLSIQLWSVVLVILKIYYNASIVGEVEKLEAMLASGSSTLDYMDVSIEYIANCIVYIILFCSVPVLVGTFMVKSAGQEMFSKMIGMGSAGTSAVASSGGRYGGKAAGAVGGAVNQGFNALEGMANRSSSSRPGSLTNISEMEGLKGGR